MKCEVIRDLLLGYLENTISKETRREIEAHLKECEACRNIYRDAEDSSALLAGLRDERAVRLESERNVVRRAKRRLQWKIGAGLLALLLVAGFALNMILTSRAPAPLEVASAEEYAELTIPGWKLARELGAVVDLNQRVEGIILESIWYGPENTYLLYTTNSRVLYAGKIFINDGQAGPDALPGEQEAGWSGWLENTTWKGGNLGGRSAQGFHGIMVLPRLDPGLPALPLRLKMMPRVGFNHILGIWTSHLVTSGAEIRGELPYHGEAKSEPTRRIAVNRELNLPGGQLLIKDIVLSPSSTLVNGEVLSADPARSIKGIRLSLESGGREYRNTGVGISGTAQGRSVVFIETPPLEALTGEIRLHVESIRFDASGTYRIDIPWKRLREGELDPKAVTGASISTAHGMIRFSGIDVENGKLEFRITSDGSVPKPRLLLPWSWPPAVVLPDGSEFTRGFVSGQRQESETLAIYDFQPDPSLFNDYDEFSLEFRMTGSEIEVNKTFDLVTAY